MRLTASWRNLVVLAIATVIALLAGFLGPFKVIDYTVHDWLMTRSEALGGASRVVILGVDDVTLEAFSEPMVLWHRHLAAAIDGARLGKAAALGMDLIPSISVDSVDPALDRALFKALREANLAGLPVVLGFDAGESGMLPDRKFRMVAGGLGYLNLWSDEDGVIRDYHPRSGEKLLSLAAGMAMRLNPKLTLPEPLVVDYRKAPFTALSLSEVVQHARAGDKAWLRQRLENKAVLLGVVAAGLHDHHAAPPSPANAADNRINGVNIHGLALDTLLAGDAITPLGGPWLAVAALAIALLSGLILLLLPPSRAVLLLLLGGAVLPVSAALLFEWNYLLPAAPFVLALVIPAAICGLYRYIVEYRQYRKLQGYFNSYVSPAVMRDIIERGEVELGGATIRATVMFTDIRNFTSLSERMPPAQVVAGLNRYFEAMTQIVIRHGGYLNRYLGDGILAIFGAPNALPDDGARAAADAALEMLDALEELNYTRLFPCVDAIDIGIGIHTGEAIVGNLGCTEKMDYSIIGDTVNLASRIESETKRYRKPILMSESTLESLGTGYGAEFMDSVQVKGREQQVRLFRLISKKGSNAMMRKFGILVAGLLVSVTATAVEFGIVMDIQGKVTIERAGKQMPADFGMAVELGDRVVLGDQASATIVSYLDCQELRLTGPAQAAANGEQLSVTPASRLQAGRILPVCYGEDELNTSDADIIGGVVLRGAPRDPVHRLRTEFSEGKASTSTLMTLLMHDLANGDTEQARPYFDALQQKAPGSAFLARVAPLFE